MPDIKLPQTRYYGSKRKLINIIWQEISKLNLNFDSVLDVFGGSGIFSYYAKKQGKAVYYNDIFRFNYLIGKILIEKNCNELSYEEAISLLSPKENKTYKSIIADFFDGVYFTDIENKQIDIFLQNTLDLENESKQLSAYYLIFQSCIIKRPYNLFHRNNLYMRTNYSGGNFGNKKTWERSFEELFERFIKELDECVFDNNKTNISSNQSALNCEQRADLIYIDPPYFNNKKTHITYHSKYHFLEGLANYENIPYNINWNKKNKEININKSKEFETSSSFLNDLHQLISFHQDSIIVISYRNNGVPSIEEIENLVSSVKPNNKVLSIDLGQYGYALSKGNLSNREFLIIGTNDPL